MLDGRNADVALTEYGTALCFNHVFSYSLDDRLAFEVDALYFITGVLWCRVESYGEAQACMQTFPQREKLPFSVFCFDITIYFNVKC